jgi:hypothetical protein
MFLGQPIIEVTTVDSKYTDHQLHELDLEELISSFLKGH